MGEPGRLRRSWLAARSLRGRTTAGAVLVVGVALIVAAVVLVALTRRTLERNIRASAQLRVRDEASILEAGTSPAAREIPNEENVVVQVLDPDGMVIVSSPRLNGQPPIARIDPGESVIKHGIVPGEPDDTFMIVAGRADTPSGELTVIVGRTLDPAEDSASAVRTILLVVVPLLLIVMGFTAWVIVGRALSPVEAIRSEVSAISAPELHRRVPIPPGQDEIARLANTMNDMLERLDQAQRRQQRLVSDASHELRSPIAAIRQHAEVAQAHPNRTTVDELAGDVLAEDGRLERLAEDLLLLAQADEHTLRLIGRPLDLDDVVLAEARRLRQVSGLRIDTTGVSAARTKGDRQQLQRVVRNLSDNAVRHAATVVRLALREDDGRVVLEVDDDGPGVPVELRSSVFERFTRLDAARGREQGGAGLGLAIVAEIVAAHGGSVTAGDAPLGGARFVVTLPRITA